MRMSESVTVNATVSERMKRVSVGVMSANERAEDQGEHTSENRVTRAHIKVVNERMSE